MSAERFFSNVDRSGGADACHPWTGPRRNRKGYGSFVVDGKAHVAHRWLLGYLRGRPLDWPAEIGCHTCDNPPCCNPAHLYVGSHVQNTADAIERSGHPAAARRLLTHCASGHEFTPDNTRVYRGSRWCRTCKRIQSNENAKRARKRRGMKPRVRLSNGQYAAVE